MKIILKKTYLLIIICVLLLACDSKNDCSYINDYYPIIYEAQLAYYKEDYNKAYDLFETASLKCELLNQRGIYETRKFAESAVKIGDTAKAFSLIRKMILQGSTIDELKHNQIFTSLFDKKLWLDLENESQILREEYLNKINLKLRSELSNMIYEDQKPRLELRTTKNEDSTWILINRVDSINEIKLKNIIEKFGYPNEELIGVYNIDKSHVNPITLLFHFDDYEYWTKKLKTLIDKGDAPPNSLATFVDSYQRRVNETDRFIYGLYDNVSDEEIKDFSNLDKRRQSIGLPTMAMKKKVDSFKMLMYQNRK